MGEKGFTRDERGLLQQTRSPCMHPQRSCVCSEARASSEEAACSRLSMCCVESCRSGRMPIPRGLGHPP